MAVGFKGQRIIVVPSLNLVVALTANLAPSDEPVAVDVILRNVARASPARTDSPLASEGAAVLADQIARSCEGKPGKIVWEQDTPQAPK